MARHPNIVNGADLPWKATRHGERFGYERRSFTAVAGGRQLGASLFRVPPGRSAFPYHLHHANEEALYILAGRGELRLGGETYPVAAGDYVALPAGPAHAHALHNPGPEPLEYLCLSTMIAPEVVEYPDSDKVGVMAGSAPGGDPARRLLSGFYKRGTNVDYYEGE